MVQTRAGRGAPEQNVVDIARSARPTRRRAGADTTTTARRAQATTTTTTTNTTAGATSRLRRGKGKEKVVPSSVTEEEMEEEGEDEDVPEGEEEEEEEEEEEIEEDEGRNEPPARFNARHVFKGSMSPPPSESEMGSQSVAGTQRYMTPGFANAGYTRYSNPLHLPGIEDDGVDDSSEIGDVTRLSQEEVDESQYREEAELKENALDSLWHNSEGLAKLLRDPKPKKKSWHRLLEVLRRNWFSTRIFFATEDELFIDLPRTVRHISAESQIKARAVIVGANATALLDTLSEAVLDPEHDHFLRVFDHLDEDFPAPFCPNDDWAENIAEEDVELALDIRTHRFITRLKNLEDERQSPADVASDIFCAVEASVDAEEALHNGPYKGIKGHETERFGERARTILELIHEKSVAEAFRILEDRFPLERPLNGIQKHPDVVDDFVAKISAWCGRIIDDIRQGLRASPLLPARESSPTDSLASSAAQDIVRKDVHEDILSRSNVHLLARLSRQKQPSQATGSFPASTDPRRATTREPTVNGGFDDYEDDGRREPSLAPTDVEGILADLPSTAITRNSIQPSPAEAGAGGTPAPVVRSGFTPVNGAKRAHSQSQDADDGFEHDDREPDPQRRAQLDRDRRNMPPPPSRPQKRVRLPSTAPLPSSSARRADLLPPNGSAPLPPASSSSSRGSLPSSTNSSIASFRELSEMNRRAASRGPQQRVPWSERDTRRLIRLIEYHNCLWARIAKRQLPEHRLGEPGPEVMEDCVFDHPRDQQAIRDKARNLKVDMLKADLNLYPGFDGVALGKKERQTLISRGKNPDRREADVDEDGAPTHTEYVPLDDDEGEEEEREGEEVLGY
ncbi:myb DNA-binding domain-containing protein [Colletotrichum incanum]|nr:myb DNA-binding domain-containing protein [Colletotrichum incanum]